MIFVLIHAVLWSVALNTFAGFRSVSPTWKMVGQNYGLSRISYIARILIPGAFPSILTGLKVGWAFAWRTLIAAELVFGVSSGSGSLGWFIFERKNQLTIKSYQSSFVDKLIPLVLLAIVGSVLILAIVGLRTVIKAFS